jgi:hypothetical protein
MRDFPFTTKYAFTLTSTMNQRLVGDVPGGTRLDLAYLDGGTSTITVDKNGGLFPKDTTGTIITGQDWVLVGEDGVADFDGRLTARIGDVIIGGHLQGRADLKTLVVGKQTIKTNAYETWYGGVGPDAKMPLVLPIVFEIPNPNVDSAEAQGTANAGASSPANAPAAGPNGISTDKNGSTNSKASAKKAATILDGLDRLRRCLAVGKGQVTFKPNQQYSPIDVITLDIFCVVPAGEQP